MKADPLTTEELSLLLGTFKAHFPREYPLALTVARKGMLRGEATGLKWGDVDFNGGFVMVRCNRTRGQVETTKHHSIKVMVDICGHLVPGANLSAVDALDDAPGCTPYALGKKSGTYGKPVSP